MGSGRIVAGPPVVIYEGYASLGIRRPGHARRVRGLGPRRQSDAQARGAQPVVLGAALRFHAPAIAGRAARSGNGSGRRHCRSVSRSTPGYRRVRVPVLDEKEELMANEYDVVVIGSGTGGYVAAIRAAQLGLKTAVVERAPVLGGTCLNWGCIPTKALHEHAHALKIAQDWKEWGLTIGDAKIGIDMNKVQSRKDTIVKGLTGGVELLFKKNKIDWIKGSGRLAGKGTIEITNGQQQTLTARKEIIVATGSTPRSVPGIEIDRQRIITSNEAIHLKEIPRSIVIMGSGAVGV